jgi:hypothetical protein
VLTMDNHNYPKAEDLVLLFSLSFDDGAILTKEAFLTFLRKATRDEVITCEYLFLKAEQAALTDYLILTSGDVSSSILGTLEVH